MEQNLDNHKDSFFDFDNDIKTDIALSKDELFSILDQTDRKTLKDRKNKKKKEKVFISEVVPENLYSSEENDDFDSRIAILTVDQLLIEYSEKKKTGYFIEENRKDNEYFEHNTPRNSMLDNFSKIKADPLIGDESKNILDDTMQIIESEQTGDIKDKNDTDTKIDIENDDFNLKNFDKNNKESSSSNTSENIDEIKEVMNYLDDLLDALPEEKIKEFVKSDYYRLYKKVITELNKKKVKG
ncbi:MAG: hypothetical protein KBG82_08975 [Spirochaetes bacterium]|nr:hypothetical protein [Spirochaetota bacterium]MBP8992096.1 hypothetical protein [Spirochaetota bacterium]